MIWTALGIGFFGSLHCMGMCGPIILVLPQSLFRKGTGILLYNAGRVAAYAAMGLIFGSIGQVVSLAGLQQWLSIVAGIFILAMIIPALFGKNILHIKGFSFLQKYISAGISKAITKSSTGTLLLGGFMNGLLPCGLVYLALAGAVATGDMLLGAAYMALFGLGTVPMLTFIVLGKKMMPYNLREKFRAAMPVSLVVVGLLILVRGLNLNIPYVSPKIQKGKVESCH